jgi:hypothetical protein
MGVRVNKCAPKILEQIREDLTLLSTYMIASSVYWQQAANLANARAGPSAEGADEDRCGSQRWEQGEQGHVTGSLVASLMQRYLSNIYI